MDITFVEVDKVPKIEKAGGSGRAAEPWENHLAPRKEKQGKAALMGTFEGKPPEKVEGLTPEQITEAIRKSAKGRAQNRVSAIRKRLDKQVANENWDFAVRPTPDNPDTFSVYVTYNGTFSNEQIVENARKRQAHSESVKAARAASLAAKAAAEATNGSEAATESTQQESPKEKATASSGRKR